MQDFMNYFIAGLTRGSMYALIALGYTLVYGVLQLINFAHSEVFMSGAFGSYIVVDLLVGDSGKNIAVGLVPLVLAAGLLAGAVSGGGVAWTLERVAYRPLRKRGAPKLAFLISAIGASFFLSQFAGKIFTNEQSAFPDFFNPNKTLFRVFGAAVQLFPLIVIVAAVLLMIALDRLVNRTKLGQSIRAIAEDAPTAALMGVDIDRAISRTFIIGGALGGAAGFMWALQFGYANTMGFQPGIAAFAAAVLGGIGNVRGAMIGGLIIGVVESVVPTAPWVTTGWIGIGWTEAMAFIVLVAVLMFRPTGILGERLGRAA